MRWTRAYIVMLLLGVGLLGALLGALAQDPAAPWPPPPVPPPKVEKPLEYPADTTEESEAQPVPFAEEAPPAPPPPTMEPKEVGPVGGYQLPGPQPRKTPPNKPADSGPPMKEEEKPPVPLMKTVPIVTAPAVEEKPPALPMDEMPAGPAIPIAESPPPEPTAPAKAKAPAPSPSPSKPEMPRAFPEAVAPPPPVPPITEKEKPNGKVGAIEQKKETSAPPLTEPLPEPLPPPAPPVATPAEKNPPVPSIPILPGPPALKPVPAAAEPEPRRPPAFRLVTIPQLVPENPSMAEPPHKTYYGDKNPLARMAAPAVTVAKHGPTTWSLGQPLSYVIVVTNVGQLPVPQLQVIDELPAGTRLVKAEPAPRQEEGKLSWAVEQLGPGQERRFTVEVLPASVGEWSGQVTAILSVSNTLRTRITEAPLTIKVNGPDRLNVGQVARFELLASNNGKEPLSHLVLQVLLPPGLTHPMGRTIEADVGDLSPGGSKTVNLPLAVVAPGKHQVTVNLQASEGQTAVGQAVLEATEGTMEIRARGPNRLLLDRVADMQIEVVNHQTKPVKNVVVTATLPEGLEYLQASDRGLYRSQTRSVHWMLDHLPPGRSYVFSLRLDPKAPGQHVPQLTMRGDEGEEVQATTTLLVEGITNLAVKVMDRDDPLEVGKETIYEIRVINQGNVAASQVLVQALVPEGMKAISAKGVAQGHIDGQTVVFAPLPRLQPRGQAVFYITTQALAPGDKRLRVQVSSDQNRQPLVKEERTWVYRD